MMKYILVSFAMSVFSMTTAFASPFNNILPTETSLSCDKIDSQSGQIEPNSHEIKVRFHNEKITRLSFCRGKCGSKNFSFKKYQENTENYVFTHVDAIPLANTTTVTMAVSGSLMKAVLAKTSGEGLIQYSVDSVGFFSKQDISFNLNCRIHVKNK